MRCVNYIGNIDSLFCVLTEIEHGVLQERMFAVVRYHRSALVDAVVLESNILIRLPPLLARAQSLVL